MLKKVLLSLAFTLAVLAVFISTQPYEFKVTRSTIIQAPPEAVFENVNNLHKWEAWSPWAKLDPNAKTTFEGPEAGKGAIMRWDGNMEVGKGSMTIVESKPNEQVLFNLDFEKPLPGTNTAEFLFKAEDVNTKVIWSMHGKQNFLGKAMGLIFNCEKMVGENFDKGLASLKALAEKK